MPPKHFNDGREEALVKYVSSQNPRNATEVLSAIDEYVETKGRMMIFQQPKVDATRKVLSQLNPPPKVLVELGGYVGKSAIAWGEMLRVFNPGQEGEVKVFSLELETKFVEIIRELVSLAKLDGTVEVVQGKSEDSLRALKRKGIETVDVLFVDHYEEFYLPDLRLCEELGLLRKGTVIVADNTDMPGAPEYLKYIEAGGEGGFRYRCETVQVEAKSGKPNAVHFAFVEAVPSS